MAWMMILFITFFHLSSATIEILDFLDPQQGSVAIHELLVQKGREVLPPEEEIMVNYQAEDQNSDNSRPITIHRCNSSSVHTVPCLDDEDSQACEEHNIQHPCIVPIPRGYMRMERWPMSVEKVRTENVGERSIARLKARGLLDIHGGRISFHGSDAQQYINDLLQLCPGLELGRKTRLALNMEAGVGSLSVELDKHDVLTLSVAGKNAKNDAVQIILERGYPAMVQSWSNNRLPFPSQAFDILHCGGCTIPWTRKGGLLLLEADRILQRGGYFIWKNTSGKERLWTDMLKAAVSMCWNLVVKRNELGIWQKPLQNTCYKSQNHCPLCSTSPDDAWRVPLQQCIAFSPKTEMNDRYIWPTRLLDATQRGLSGRTFKLATVEAYKADFNYWVMLTDFYLTSLGPSRIRDIRNVLDASAGYGGFAAALASKKPALSWWVLNVSPVDNSHLMNIFDRGLLGVYHDWCRALNMHARSFDLVHASRLFSAKHNCSMLVIMVEVDRLLRPGGFAIIRDELGTLIKVQSIANALHWKTTIQDTDSGPQGKDKVMHCQKTSWQPS